MRIPALAVSLLLGGGCAQILGFEEREPENTGPEGDGGLPFPPQCVNLHIDIFGMRYPVDPGARTLSSGDFNDDGFTDLVVSAQSSKELAIWLGDGNGGLVDLQPLPLPIDDPDPGPTRVMGGDLNGDELDDLVVIAPTKPVMILFQDPADPGSFLPALEESPDIIGPPTLALGDLDRDGSQDIVLVAGDGIVILLHNLQAPGTFRIVRVDTPGQTTSPFIGDVDDDGSADVVAMVSGRATVFFQGDTDTFLPPVAVGVDGSFDVAAGHVDGDLLMDLAVVSSFSGTTRVFLQGPPRNFTAGPTLPFVGGGDLRFVDINDDGHEDLVSNFSWLPHCTESDEFAADDVNVTDGVMLFVDLNGDQKLDAVEASPFQPYFTVHMQG